jgi:hypothetical protein
MRSIAHLIVLFTMFFSTISCSNITMRCADEVCIDNSIMNTNTCYCPHDRIGHEGPR